MSSRSVPVKTPPVPRSRSQSRNRAPSATRNGQPHTTLRKASNASKMVKEAIRSTNPKVEIAPIHPEERKMSGRFAGKVVIVTGSSNGIGRETAKMFAAEGAKLTITGRSVSSLEETKNLIIAAGAKPDEIVSVIGDLREEATAKKLIDDTVSKNGKIDVLINNAGSLSSDNSSLRGFDAPLEDFDATMNLNLRSVVALTKLALPYLEKTKGNIVMVSSIAAINPNVTFPYYAMSKAAMDSMTRSLAMAYVEKGVRVNAVNPGWTSTAIMQKLGMTAEGIQQFEDKLALNRQQLPMGRPARPSEIGELILFLADNSKSEYIIGQCIVIDGGRSLVRPAINPNDS